MNYESNFSFLRSLLFRIDDQAGEDYEQMRSYLRAYKSIDENEDNANEFINLKLMLHKPQNFTQEFLDAVINCRIVLFNSKGKRASSGGVNSSIHDFCASDSHFCCGRIPDDSVSFVVLVSS
jgi:hypothetical protein